MYALFHQAANSLSIFQVEYIQLNHIKHSFIFKNGKRVYTEKDKMVTMSLKSPSFFILAKAKIEN